MFRSHLVAHALGAVALSGCAYPASGYHPYAPPPSPPVPEAMADVARLRGLPMTEPVPFVALDEPAFRRAASGKMGPQSTRAERDEDGSAGLLDQFAQAFTMGSGESVRRGAGAIYDAELGGFYDSDTKRLYLRGEAPEASPLTRAILEHETEHALQDRAFSFPNLAALPLDESLAIRALYEGDATLTMAVVEAARDGLPPATAIANLVRSPAKMSVEAMTRQSTAEVRRAPPLIREEIFWPYAGGTAFVAALASTGGWPLLNAAFAHPPTTTEQVLHVEKYLAGEQAVEVAPPPLPDGYRGESRGRMGELATRVFLQQCSSDVEARQASRGWGGDAFAIVTKDAAQSLLWITTWDDALSAARFARALESRRECARTGPKPDLTVVREGARVAFVQGLEGPGERQRQAELLFPLVGEPPSPRPPFSSRGMTLRTTPPVQEDFTGRGKVVGDWFVDEAIGVRAPTAGMVVTPDARVDLSARGDLRVALAALWGPPSDALGDAVIAALVKGLRESWQPAAAGVFEGKRTQMSLSWARATVRTFRFGRFEEQRVVLAPLCDGRMTLMLFVARNTAQVGDERAEKWLRAVQTTSSSPACEALKSLRDPEEN